MDHRLVHAVEKALGWSGPSALGAQFAQGRVSDPGLCARLLTPTRLLDLVMRRSLVPPQVRCLQNGTDLHPRDYIATTTTRRGQAVAMVDMRRLGRLIQTGATLVLDAADTFDPTMEVACCALQWWSRELVQVNIYLTTRDATGFQLHWDDHDVLVVQLGGEKTWEVRGPSRLVPMYRDAQPNTEPSDQLVWAGTLTAGDVLHIPRGYWHQATRNDQAADGFSLHVTFGFVQRTGVDWLSWVADHSREQELFRHDLDRWGTPTDRQSQADALAEAATRLITSHPPAEFLDSREQQHPPPRNVATWATFGPPTAVVCVTEFRPTLQVTGGNVEVLAAGRKITFTAQALPVLHLLLSGHPTNLAAVSTRTGIDAGRVTDVLLREGLCAEVTEELFSGYTGLATTEDCLKAP